MNQKLVVFSCVKGLLEQEQMYSRTWLSIGNWLDRCGLQLLWSHVSDSVPPAPVNKSPEKRREQEGERVWFLGTLSNWWQCFTQVSYQS